MSQTPTQHDYRLNDDFLDISGIDFYGPYIRSPNSRFLLAWQDADPSRGVGGARDRGNGRYVLIDDERIILVGELQRPNDGVVADDGTFAINDWLFSRALNGVFYVITADEHVLIRHRTRANLDRCGISDDGQYAACSTAGADGADGSKVLLFDVSAGKLLWKLEPVCSTPQGFIFDTKAHELFLHIGGGECYRYSFTGDFLDEKAWQEGRLKRALDDRWGYSLLDIADERLAELEKGECSQSDFAQVVDWTDIAANKDVSDNVLAGMYRALGEVAEAMGWCDDAIRFFRTALARNPHVGVKRRLQELEKNVSVAHKPPSNG